jgi:hypothetical protein
VRATYILPPQTLTTITFALYRTQGFRSAAAQVDGESTSSVHQSGAYRLSLVGQNFLLSLKDAGVETEIVECKKREKEENLKENSLTDKIADDWTEDNILTKASTKLLTLDRLLGHYWSGNPKPPVYRQDGTRDLDEEALLENPLPSDRPRKFLIYVEYRSHRMLVIKVSIIHSLFAPPL